MYIDVVMNQLLYIDPLGPPDEQGVAKNFSSHWLESSAQQHFPRVISSSNTDSSYDTACCSMGQS